MTYHPTTPRLRALRRITLPLAVIAMLWLGAALLPAASPNGEYLLTDFGPVGTAAEAEAALQAAIPKILAAGGGLLIIPPETANDWTAVNASPSSSKAHTPAVTLLDRRHGRQKTLFPTNGQATGSGAWTSWLLSREVRQPIDMVYGVHSTEVLETAIAGGTASYSQPILEEVKAGNDARVYVTTIRGLAAGLSMVLSGEPLGYGTSQGRDIGPIKTLGWDKERRLPYVTMDLQHDHPKGVLLNNKHVVNSLTVTDMSQSDNQSMGLMVRRDNYGQGDSFVISARSVTQGNVMSAAGDEGGLTYASDISNDLSPFRSKVESMDWEKGELIYEPGAVRNHTLGTSRPIINMNPKKHITQGKVWIIAPGHKDPWEQLPGQPAEGGTTGPLPGGAIIGSRDCGWSKDLIGRFFAVDEPSEYLDPKNDPPAGYTNAPDMRAYRWYLIQDVKALPDGTWRLFVERTRWWSRRDVVPNLYDFENYTRGDHKPPLKYIIAPGAYVADVSKAWTHSRSSDGHVDAASPRALILAPTPDIGTPFDFAKGDPIVQAIGNDPWNVSGMRVRHFNYIPSTIEDVSYDAANLGRVSVHAGLAINGGDGDLATDEEKWSKDKRPRFNHAISIRATSGVGLHFGGDTKYAAIRFEQPHNRRQAIVWNVPAKRSSRALAVNPETGEFSFEGGATRLQSLLIERQGGISAGDKPASNLRGIALPVPAASETLEVSFPTPEADAQYALWVQPSWLTTTAVTKKSASGFTVQFATPPPERATLDWILAR